MPRIPGLREFNRQVRRVADKQAPEIANRFVRGVALDAMGRVVRKTPVDTGRAQGNWRVAIDNAPSDSGTTTTDRSGAPTINRGEQRISEFDLQTNNSIIIFNNLPYIVPLEFGHSSQAPAGMVRVTIEELTQALQNINVEGFDVR